MSRRSRWRALIIVLVCVAGTVSGLVWFRYDFERVNWVWGVVGGALTAYPVIRQVIRDRDAGPEAPTVQRRAVAEQLADRVRRNPVDGGLLKSLEEPYPLPVAWINAAPDYQPSWRTICRSSEGEPLDLSGRDDGVADTFRRIPSGRLLILGQAGSGKSIMAMRLAHRLLVGRRADEPIPILLYVPSWDAGNIRFDRWVTAQIAHRYPHPSLAHARWAEALRDLLDAGLILPILDGLDEASEERAALCLRRLNEVPTQRFVLTCRTGFYNRYLQHGEKVRGAAAVVIEPLDPVKVAEYLQDGAPARQITRWTPVVEEVTGNRSGELAAALSTPLMVAMARTAFDERDVPTRLGPGQVDAAQVEPDDADPGSLVELARRGGREAVEETLLNEAVNAAIRSYRDSGLATRWPPTATRRYLSVLAGHLESHDRPEFVWWRLPVEVPRVVWMCYDAFRTALAAYIVLALAGDALTSVVAAVGDAQLRDMLRGIVAATGTLVLLAAVFGALLTGDDGVTSYQGVPPRRIVFRGGVRTLGRGLFEGVFQGAFFAAILWTAIQLYEPSVGIIYFLEPYALPVGSWSAESQVLVTVGLIWCGYVAIRTALRTDFAAPADRFTVTDPVRMLRADRSAAALLLLPTVLRAVVLVLLLCGGLDLVGLLPAMSLGERAAAGLGLGLGRWVVVATDRVWLRFGVAQFLLAVTRQLPYRLLEFLADVASVGLLRDVGGVYRFRHDRLRNLLATLGGQPRTARYREQFATSLARAGYWDEALAIFGALLTERAGRPGLDALLAAALRKSVFAGCAAGRWWRTSERLLAVRALYPDPEIPHPSAVTGKRREISELVRQGATVQRLLAACDELIEAEAEAGELEPATIEFRATLQYVQGNRVAAQEQLAPLTSREYREEPAHSTPVGAALLVRVALDGGDVTDAIAGCRYELGFTAISPRPVDIARLAESWWWSVEVLAQTEDELAEQYRRLVAAAAEANSANGWHGARLTSREWAELGLLACRARVDDPMLGWLAVLVADQLLEVVERPDRFRLTVDRSAPMWSDVSLPPPQPRDDGEAGRHWPDSVLPPPTDSGPALPQARTAAPDDSQARRSPPT
ncbi:NACHT domain-containing protein [Micromonosporaceae bacterium B7E4]